MQRIKARLAAALLPFPFKQLLWVLVCGGAIMAALLVWSAPPSDRSVRGTFDAAPEHYDRLVRMLEEDPRVGTIGDGFQFAEGRDYIRAGTAELGITEARLEEYHRLMRLAGVKRLDRAGEAGGVLFFIWAWGGIDVFHHKGVAWYRGTPPACDARRRFSPIRDNWYLFED